MTCHREFADNTGFGSKVRGFPLHCDCILGMFNLKFSALELCSHRPSTRLNHVQANVMLEQDSTNGVQMPGATKDMRIPGQTAW